MTETGLILRSDHVNARPSHEHGLFVSHKDRFLFLHVPKTAGSSLKAALCEAVDDLSSVGDLQTLQKVISTRLGIGLKRKIIGAAQVTPLRYFVTTNGHPTAALILLQNSKLRGYRKFAFVRNPYDRLVSGYEMACSVFGYDADFATYVHNCLVYLQPQVNFLFFGHRRLVEWVGRFETLEQDVAELCVWLNVAPVTLPRRNQSQLTATREYFTPSLRKRVNQVYARDFAAFGYDIE